ncbi:unannotated protein [freshwater metagenome]|uniref:Unannotated protein n=1 Tax=freshwater metagenome TaxID=449393 RepID=A0A6J6PLF1_9ZZZZ
MLKALVLMVQRSKVLRAFMNPTCWQNQTRLPFRFCRGVQKHQALHVCSATSCSPTAIRLMQILVMYSSALLLAQLKWDSPSTRILKLNSSSSKKNQSVGKPQFPSTQVGTSTTRRMWSATISVAKQSPCLKRWALAWNLATMKAPLVNRRSTFATRMRFQLLTTS